MVRACQFWLMLALNAASGVNAGPTLDVPWNTGTLVCQGQDCNNPLGPDGPWQAPVLLSDKRDNLFPLYPSLEYSNIVPNKSIGGTYNPHEDFANRANGLQYKSQYDVKEFDMVKEQMDFDSYLGSWAISSIAGSIIPLNLTTYVASKWDIQLPNGKNHTPTIGCMGLAPPDDDDLDASDTPPPGLIHQLQTNKSVGSNSFGLHMGSAKFRQPGSLVLGGYEQSRVLGEVAQWDISTALFLFLKDITFGVEQGGSPFANLTVTTETQASMWQGLDGYEFGRNMTRQYGGPDGSAMVNPFPDLPQLYLPEGNCEAMAKHLPVTYRNDIGYYTWNTEDSQFEKIVSSPAFMGFVFSTPQGKNFTIKAPFALMNLTLESPIVDTPTPYFPCQTASGNRSELWQWGLGRTFLQAAFIHMDYDKKKFHMAQAPGPTLEQSQMQTYNPGDTIKSNPISSFAKTWQSHWAVLSEDGKQPEKSTTKKKGLAGGAIAGIVIGVVVGVAVVAGLIYWFVFRRRKQAKLVELAANEAKANEAKSAASSPEELPSASVVQEIPGSAVSHEAEGDTKIVQGLHNDGIPQELPGDMPEQAAEQKHVS